MGDDPDISLVTNKSGWRQENLIIPEFFTNNIHFTLVVRL